MKDSVNITLFHWDSCGHCIRFMPVWKHIQKEAAPYKIFNFNEHEYSVLEKLPRKRRTIGGKPVDSFPTIKLEILGKEYKYNGDRTNLDLYHFILATLRHSLKK